MTFSVTFAKNSAQLCSEILFLQNKSQTFEVLLLRSEATSLGLSPTNGAGKMEKNRKTDTLLSLVFFGDLLIIKIKNLARMQNLLVFLYFVSLYFSCKPVTRPIFCIFSMRLLE